MHSNYLVESKDSFLAVPFKGVDACVRSLTLALGGTLCQVC